MSGARPGGGDSASDLFDAWMAHRSQPSAAEDTAVAVDAEPRPEPVLAAVAVEPEPGSEPEPVAVAVAVEPEPVAVAVEPEPEPVAVAVELEPEPEPEPVAVAVAVEPEPQPEPAASPEPEPAPVEVPAAAPAPTRPEGQLGISAALAAAAAQAEDDADQLQAPTSAPPAPRAHAREPLVAARAKPPAPPPADDMPAVMEFTPREGDRAIAGILLLAALVAAAMAGYLAWYERSAATVGIGCTLFILVLVIWATRASSAPAHLKVNSGHLTVQRTGSIRHFDLGSKYTALEVHGRPGLPGWKVLIEQRDAVPFVIDSSMVNPKAFMRVLRYYRPEL